jgi:hypothetical protein
VISKFNTPAANRRLHVEEDFEPEPAIDGRHQPGGIGIRVRGVRGMTVRGSTFTGLRTGLSIAKGSQVEMENLTFNNVGTAVEVTEE